MNAPRRPPKSPLFARNTITLIALASLGAGYASMKWQTLRQKQVEAGQRRLAEQAMAAGATVVGERDGAAAQVGPAEGGKGQKVVRGDYGVKVNRSGGGI